MFFKVDKVIILILLLFSGCRQEPIVAYVGDEQVSLRDFQYYLLTSVGDMTRYATTRELKLYLHEFVEKKMKLREAYDEDLHNSETIEKRTDDLKKRAILNYTLEKEVYARAIPDSLVRAYYNRLCFMAKLRQVVVPCDGESEHSGSNRTLVDSMYKRVLAGEDFSVIHKVNGNNKVTFEETGYLYWGAEGYGDEFYQRISVLEKGEISPPVKSKRGWHLVQLLDKRNAYILTFDELRSVLRHQMIRFYEAPVHKHYSRFTEKLRKQQTIVFDDSNLSFIIGKIHEIRQIDATRVIGRETAQSLTTGELAKVLFRYNERTFTVSDFLSEKGIRHPAGIPIYDSVESLKKNIVEVLPDEERIITYGFEQKYDRTGQVRYTYQEYLEQEILGEAERINILSRLKKPTRQNLLDYYNGHKEEYLDKQDPESIKEFKHVRSKVVIDFRESQIDSLQNRWMRRLNSKYRVVIYEDVLYSMIL
jgi:hypothetical protein